MKFLIAGIDYSAYIRQDTIDIEDRLTDPVPTAEFILEDPGATFPIQPLQDVVVLDDDNPFPNETRNLFQDPSFANSGSYWNGQGFPGNIVYANGTATMTIYTTTSFTSMSYGQTTQPGLVQPNQQYMLSFLYSIGGLSNAMCSFTYNTLDIYGNVITTHTDAIGVNTAGFVNYTATIPTAANAAAISVKVALTKITGLVAATFAISSLQLELITASQSYPTPWCATGQPYCNELPNLTVVRENRIFGGISILLKAYYDGPNRHWDIICNGYAILLNKTYVTSNYVDANDDDIIRDLLGTYMPGLLTANNVIALPNANYDQVSWQDISMKDAFGAIASATGTIYFVDAYASVHYQFPGYSQSNIQLSDSPDFNTSFPYYEYEYDQDATEMANRIKVFGGGGSQQIEPATAQNFTGNGSKTFTLLYQPSTVISVTVNGTAQNVGLDLKDGFADGYAVLINKPSMQVLFNTAPANGATIVVNYTYLGPPLIRVRDAGSIAKYGYTFDAVVNDSTLVSTADTYQRGLTELSAYSVPLKSMKLKTNAGPFQVGDTVAMTSAPDNLAAVPFLIQTVKLTMLGTDQTGSAVLQSELEIGAYRPSFEQHFLHLYKAVKGSSSQVSAAPAEYIVAFEQMTYSESVAGSLYNGTISGGGSPPSTSYITDTFAGRTVSGGWGTASDGINAWTINTLHNVNLSVGSGEGQAQWNGNGGSNTSAYVEMLCGPSQPANVEILVRFCGINNFNNDRAIGVWTRLNPGVSSYFALIDLDNDGNSLQVKKQVSGTYTTLGSVNISISPGQFGWLRFRTSGTFIAAKFWLDGHTEPTNWSYSTTDSSVSSSGRVGVRVGSPGQIGPVQIDHYSVTAS